MSASRNWPGAGPDGWIGITSPADASAPAVDAVAGSFACQMLAMQVGFPAETTALLAGVAAERGGTVAGLLAGLPAALAAAVQRVGETAPVEQNLAVWKHWTPVVARFSFRSRPLMTD